MNVEKLKRIEERIEALIRTAHCTPQTEECSIEDQCGYHRVQVSLLDNALRQVRAVRVMEQQQQEAER